MAVKKEIKIPAVGEVDEAGYKLEARRDNRSLHITPKGRYVVYENAWQAGEKCLLRPVTDRALAEIVLETGKIPEKPAPAPKAPKGKKVKATA